MPGWDTPRKHLALEFQQAIEEGKDPNAVNALRPRFDHAPDDEEALGAIYDELLALPIRPGFGFNEPSDLETIQSLRPQAENRRFEVDWSESSLGDKMRGAWLGRCVGCALGKPVEGFMGSRGGLPSWQRQRKYLQAIDASEWPLRDYFPQHSPAERETGKVGCYPSTREAIAFMETDDDIRYTVLGQVILRERGRGFSTWDVGRAWMSRLPYQMVCTAETQAYKNMVSRYSWHMESWSGQAQEPDWNWVATHRNAYREWIGAQIRVDSYGYAAPGRPELAADFAWRDARLSHVKNGIYGAMLCAAMIAAAFASDDPRAIVAAGLAEIPATSRLYSELQATVEICERHNNSFENFEAVIEEIYALLGHYDPVHTNNNAALCVAAVLLSGGDFHRGVTFAVMGGLDSDCNGATVGSILGALNGAARLPEHWTGRLRDTLNSEIVGYHPIPISECARRAVEIARKVAE